MALLQYPPQAPSVLDVELRLLVFEYRPVAACVEFLVFAGCRHGLVLPESGQQLYDHINIKTGLCYQPAERKIVSAWADCQ